jgi:hypothetical protein
MPQVAIKNTELSQENELFLNAFLTACKSEFGEDNYNKWLGALEIFSQSESEIIFAAPSKFIRDWVIREFVEVKGKNLVILLRFLFLKDLVGRLEVVEFAQSLRLRHEVLVDFADVSDRFELILRRHITAFWGLRVLSSL